MKNSLIMVGMMLMASFTANAQDKGRFEVTDFGSYKLHVYYTNDAMGDASFIVEGKDGLVAMEQPLFKDNVSEYNAYVKKLGKPVVKCVASYHIGGTEHSEMVVPEGMVAFSNGPIYGGMMKGFEQMWGDTMAELPMDEAKEVAFDKEQKWAGVSFLFLHGATSDFPAASILIGKDVYYTHWAPAKAHMSHLQISSPAAVDAEIAEAEMSLKSGAKLFIGGHGGASEVDAVEFKISYLKKIKELLAANKDAESFATALKTAYPGLTGEQGVGELAKALYK